MYDEIIYGDNEKIRYHLQTKDKVDIVITMRESIVEIASNLYPLSSVFIPRSELKAISELLLKLSELKDG